MEEFNSETKISILIVDDDLGLRAVTSQVLQEAGHEVVEAASAEEALDLFKKSLFYLVFTDIVMEEMDGLELLGEIKRIQPETEVVIMTSFATQERALAALRLGAYDFILKPFEDPDLIEAIANRALEKIRLHHENQLLVEELKGKNETLKQINTQLEEDIVKRKILENALRFSEAKYRSFVQNFHGIAFRWDLQSEPVFLHGALEEITTYKEEAFMSGNPHWHDVVHPDDRDRVLQARKKVISEENSSDILEYRILRQDGKIRWLKEFIQNYVDEADKKALVQGVIHDITQNKLDEREIQRLAYYDNLTSLPNRTLFNDRLSQAIALAKREERDAALLCIDLDHFKKVNDSLGHTVGDLLIEAVAKRLQNNIRKSDTVARLSGDEFAMLLTTNKDQFQMEAVARKILKLFNEPFSIDGQDVFITASIGMALFPADGMNVSTLLRNADTALYEAKKAGRKNFQLFSSEMKQKAITRRDMAVNLRRAFKEEEFFLVYQPKLDGPTCTMVGMEALLRWRNPEGEMIPPDQFIPVAEEIGLIQPLGEWVLRTACKQNVTLQQNGYPPLQIAVNMSVHQLKQHDFVEMVEAILKETTMDPRLLELELTESVLMEVTEYSKESLNQLKSLGVHLAIDDFGTGFSSLSYLKHFPFNRIKIDRSFLRDVDSNSHDASIIENIITMAHSLDLQVTAEGVETNAQLEFLTSRKCDEVQGYFLSRPLTVEDLLEYIQESLAGKEAPEALGTCMFAN